MTDGRFFGTQESYLFRAVAREVLEKSYSYCNIYIPEYQNAGTVIDRLYGETATGQMVWKKYANLRCVASRLADELVESERGMVQEATGFEFHLLVEDLENAGIDYLNTSFAGAIIEWQGMFFEVTDDDDGEYVFNDRNPIYVTITATLTTKIPTQDKIVTVV